MKEEETVIQLPDDGIINTAWAREQLERSDLFSAFSLNTNKGRVFFTLRANLSTAAFEQSVGELDYTIETAMVYIRFLEKLPVLEAIREKYFTALSLSAAELLPETIEEAVALIDVCLARVGKPTAKNLAKALDLLGKSPKKLTNAAISVEALRKKSLNEWLLNEHAMSEDDIMQASTLSSAGKLEYLEKMLQAYSLLEDWKQFYTVIAEQVHKSGDMKALRFLADMQDASGSILEYLDAEANFNRLVELKEEFTNTVYPVIQFEANKEAKSE